MQSPVKSFRSLHATFVAEKLRQVSDECVQHVNNTRGGKPSELGLCVNDSQSGALFKDCYEQGEMLAEGGFAMVYHCRHKANKSYYAVKEVLHIDYEDGTNSLRDEIAALKCLRESPYIVRLHDVFYEKDTTWLVMEEMKGGDLLDKITEKQTYSEDEAKKVTSALLEAVRFCHKKRIAHRDIKPENVLLVHSGDDTTIKLCDFGCARTLTMDAKFTTMIGSPQYAAPEIYDHSELGGYDEKCDLWSIGVVVYVLLGGYAPFEGNVVDLPRMICNADYVFHKHYWCKVSEKPKDFIRSLLVVDPAARLTADQALDSRWLRRPELNRSASDRARASKKQVVNQKLYESLSGLNAGILFNSASPVRSPTPIQPFQISPVTWVRSPVKVRSNDKVPKPDGPAPLEPFQKSPMKWLPKSPVVTRVRRELSATHRRQKAKQTLGESLASLHASLNDSDDMLCLHESVASLKSDNNASMASIFGLPSIPRLDAIADGSDDEGSLNPDEI